MKRILTFLILLTIGFAAYSQQHLCPPTITHQGVTYSTVWVGGNCWMKENLRSTAYASQSNVVGFAPTYVVYPNVPYSFGYLYTWYSAVGLPEGSTANPPTAISERVQGICPNEWAMPSITQLASLYAAGEPRDNAAAYWVYGSAVAPSGTNGFNMLPAGYYNAQTQNFYEYKLAGYLWALNYNGTTSSCGIFPFDCRTTSNMTMNKYNMLSVRCVKAPPYGVEEITACDSYTWNGNTYTETGRYVANLPNDSVSTLLLTVNYTTYGTLNIIACDSYYWDLTEDTYTTSGTHMATIQNYLGCDSIVTLNLEVRYSNTGIDVQNHCDAYEWIDGITYTESTNEPTFVVTNAAGCDSTVTLNLTIRKMTTGIDVQNHCDTYTWIDGNTYTESSNDNTYTLTNAAGCDSVVTLDLTIRKKTYGIDVQDHCDTYTWINGITYTASTNEPVFTITNAAGCDSIVTLNLTIRNSTSSPSVSLTEYNTFTWNEMTYTTSGIYTATLTNAVGCDSTATLDLTILYRFPITYNLDGGAFSSTYPENYVQGVGATLEIPVKTGNRFDGWFDNAEFTGDPITMIGNTESGDKQFWALWTVEEMAKNSFLSFAGNTTSYAQIADEPSLNPTSTISIEAWIYPTAWRSSSYQGSIVAKEIATGNGGYVLRCGSSGTLNFAVGIGTGFQEVTSTGLTLNEWQHVAGVYDGATLKIYRNGVLLNTKTQTGTINVSSNPIEIGRNPAYNDRYFQGNIDEVRIWNSALDQATLQTWYNKSLTSSHANYSNLFAYYELDNTLNSAAVTGTVGSNGTVAGATYGSGCNFAFASSSTIIDSPTKVSASHPTTAIVMQGNQNVQVLKVEIETNITASATQITLTTDGTTNVADITNAKLWFTGTTNSFAMTTAFGSVIANPNGTMTFTGSQALSCGKNYFWLTYDIVPTATFNNYVDATVTNATVERLFVSSINGNPAGNRKIADACSHTLQIRDTYGDGWNGGKVSLFVNNSVIYTDLTFTTSGTGWFDYPFFAEFADTLRVIRTADGSYPSEMMIRILGGNGGPVILAEVQPATGTGVFTTGACYVPVTSSVNGNGTITPSGTTPVLKGGSQTYTFVPNQYYFIGEVLVNGVNNPTAVSAGTYTFNNVTTPQTILINFATNYITPIITTPPTTTGGAQGNLLSSLTLSGGLAQHNGVDVAGSFAWTNPTTILTAPGNYSVTFTPVDTNTYFRVVFNINVNVSIINLTVANGATTSSYIPFEGYNLDGAQHNQMIYPASMLTAMVGRQITSMTFYLSSPPSAAWTAVSTFKIGTTTTTTLSGLITAPETAVYTGLMPVVSNTVTITFSAPFTYTGDNLIIDFSNVVGNWKSATFYGVSQTSASYYTRGSTLTSYGFLPKIKFELVP